MILYEAQISSKRQITLPINIMKKLHLNPGDKLAFDEVRQQIIIKPSMKKSSATEIHKRFNHIVKKKVSQDKIDQARQESYTEKI